MDSQDCTFRSLALPRQKWALESPLKSRNWLAFYLQLRHWMNGNSWFSRNKLSVWWETPHWLRCVTRRPRSQHVYPWEVMWCASTTGQHINLYKINCIIVWMTIFVNCAHTSGQMNSEQPFLFIFASLARPRECLDKKRGNLAFHIPLLNGSSV